MCRTQVLCRPRPSRRRKKVQQFSHIIVQYYQSQQPAVVHETPADLMLARPRKY